MAECSRRYTIGYFIQFATTPGGFQDMIWRSMVKAAEKKEVNALLFAGGMIDAVRHHPFPKNLNFIYDLARSEKLDGIVVNNVLGASIGEDRFRGFCLGFGRPVVLAFGILPGLPSVRVRGCNGMRDLLLHLIDVHGARRIAFIMGTHTYADSVERFRTYRKTLAERDIPYDPALVFEGRFDIESGVQAVRHWLDRKGTSFDAVAASNDAMAMGAIDALRARGREVPWDVAVTGFDDTADASSYSPPLTTVRQPFEEIHMHALDLLCALIEGRTVRRQAVELEAPFVIRRSCGCMSGLLKRACDAEEKAHRPRKRAPAPCPPLSADARPSEVIVRVLRQVKPEEEKGISDFAESFAADADGRRPGSFIGIFERLIGRIDEPAGDILGWQVVLLALRERLHTLRVDDAFRARADSLILQASVLVGESAAHAAAYRKALIEKRMKMLVEGGQELITTFDFEELREAIARQLNRLGIPACHIALFRNPDDPTNGVLDYLSMTGGVRRKPKKHAAPNLAPLLPGKPFFPADRRFLYAVHPLSFREHRLGYALFELGPAEGVIYNTLEILISSALMGSSLFLEQQRTQAEQNKQIERQHRYAAELEAAVRELESFSYMVSHDLRAPLRAMNGFAKILAEEYGAQLPPQAMRHIATIRENARRMGLLIDGILEFSRLSRQPLERSTVRHNELIKEALELLRPEADDSRVQMIVDDLPETPGDPLLLRHVWVNLIGNALKFTRGRPERRIEIGFRLEINRFVFFVRDNGVGFDMRHAGKLFGVFQRLHRDDEYEGTGVGLAIVQRIIQRHGGRVWAEAEPDKGATFSFTLE